MKQAIAFLATILFALLAGVSSFAADAPARPFRAGAATSNLTPPLGISINGNFAESRATHVHDELHARCLVLDDGTTRLAIAVCDNTLIPREVHDAAKQRASEATGIPIGNILISATHSHSCGAATSVFGSDADEDYKKFLAVRIADGICRACNNLAPARIGWGVGSLPGQVFNRRWHMKPGVKLPNPFGGFDQVRMNPGAGNPDLLEPAGPTDPGVSVVSVQSADGRPVALLANYSLHYVGGVGPGHISADYFGVFCDRVQELLKADREDPPFVAMLSNGTSGDVNNINFRSLAPKFPPYGKMRAVAIDLAAEAVRVTQRIQYRDWVPLGARRKDLTLGIRLPSAADVERAKGILAKAEGRALKGAEEVYARETVLMSRWPAEDHLVIQAFRIGDLAVTQIPCEVFAEIGLDIKQRSPFKPTFTVELANGYSGYLPTPAQHEMGGYETWRARSSYLETGASTKITAMLMELLDGLRN
jgi:neutral ceramidase